MSIRADVHPLPALRKGEKGLEQAVRLTIQTHGPEPERRCHLTVRTGTGAHEINLGDLPPGPAARIVFLPETTVPCKEEFSFRCGEAAVSYTVRRNPVRRWTIHLVLHSHTDLGFTAPLSDIVQVHNRNTDLAVEYCRATETLPDGERFRWTCEVSWQIQNYLKDRSPERIHSLIECLRQGQMEVGALYAGEHTDLLGHEEAVRSLSFASWLRREFGIQVDTAMLCDVPGCTWGFVQILAGSGISNLIVADNNFGAPFLSHTDLPRPFLWESPDGSSVLAWYTDHAFYAYMEGELYGFLEDADAVFERLLPKLATLDAAGYIHHRFQLQYAFDNAEITFKPAEVAAEWNRRWEYPRIRLSTAREFLNALRRERRGEFPCRAGDWTSWWAGIAPGFPVESALSRRLHDRIPVLEKRASVVSMLLPRHSFPHDAINRCYDGVLAFDEHSGGGGVWKPESEEQLKRSLQEGYGTLYSAAETARDLETELLKTLSGCVEGEAAGRTIVVINDLSWDRTGVVRFGGEGNGPAAGVIDRTTGRPVLLERDRDGGIRFLAERVPGFGYATYTLREKPSTEFPSGTTHTARPQNGSYTTLADGVHPGEVTIRNARYRAVFERTSGRLRRLEERDGGVLVITPSPPPLLCFWHSIPVVPVELGKYIHEHYTGVPSPGEEIPPPAGNTTVIEKKDGFGERVTICHAVDGVEWLREQWDLPSHEEGVRATVTISRGLVGDPALRAAMGDRIGPDVNVYLRFPFALNRPDLRYEAPGMVLQPARDQFRGTCRDFFAVGHWLVLSDPERNIAFVSRDAPLVDPGSPGFLKYRRELDPDLSTLFVRAVALNEWGTNRESPYSNGEDLVFRFVFLSYPRAGHVREDLAPAIRLGWEETHPLEATMVASASGGPLTSPSSRFLSVGPGNVLLLTMKQAEDGDGLIIRLLETVGERGEASITFHVRSPARACRSTLTEEDLESLEVRGSSVLAPLRPHSIETVRVRFPAR